jgi:hypothetical protein
MPGKLIKRLSWFCLGLVWSTTASAQTFRYQFQDQPYPEANVIIVEHQIVPGESSQWLLEGRVFNRGVKPAKNVRVVYTIWRSGARLPGNPIYLTPGEVPGTSFASFRERLPQLTDPHDAYVTVTVEWDK